MRFSTNHGTADWQKCPTCRGRKTIATVCANGVFEIDCQTCNGCGFARAAICEKCHRLPRSCSCPAPSCGQLMIDPASHLPRGVCGKPPAHWHGTHCYCAEHNGAASGLPVDGRTLGELRRASEDKP